MYFINNQNVGILLLFVISHAEVKMAESFAANTVSLFRSPKTGEEESKLLEASIPKSTAYKTKWAIKIFHQWQINRKDKGPVIDAGEIFFQSPHGKMWSPKSVNKILPSQRNTIQNFWSPDGKFWSPMFL